MLLDALSESFSHGAAAPYVLDEVVGCEKVNGDDGFETFDSLQTKFHMCMLLCNVPPEEDDGSRHGTNQESANGGFAKKTSIIKRD